MLVAALAAVLITSATLAITDNADARKNRNSQNSIQINSCENGKCQNANSQIQGDRNAVVVLQSQH